MVQDDMGPDESVRSRAVARLAPAGEAAFGVTRGAGRTAGWLRRNRAKAVALIVVAVVVAWFLWPEGAEPPPPPVTAPVVRGDIEQLVAAAGTLAAGKVVDVGAQVSGQLEKLHVRLGDLVSEGDMLAEIDDFIQQSRVTSAQANLESLQASSSSQEASLSLAHGDLKRQERLMKAQATTEVEYDRAAVNLTQAEANLTRHRLQIEQAKASVEEARAMLDYTRITAPSDGTVVNIFAQEGQTLNAAQQAPVILRIGDLRTVTVSASVSEADVRLLKAGMEAYFTTPADGERRWRGQLKEISPIPRGPGGAGGLALFDAIVEVENPDGALLPGMTAKVFFVVDAARDVLKVPRGAVTFSGGPMSAAGQYAQQILEITASPGRAADAPARPVQPPGGATNDAPGSGPPLRAPGRPATVQVMGPGGERQLRTVRVGAASDVEVEVLSGLSGGEQVVVGVSQPPMPAMPPFGGPGF